MNDHIRINALTVVAQDRVIIDSLNLTLSPQKPCTILGETGAGKSILALAILGKLPAGLVASGEIWVNGVSMLNAHCSQKQKLWGRKIVMLPQEPRRSLSPLMRISRQVSEVLQFVKGQRRTVADEGAYQLLDDVGLQGHGHKVPFHLSGGMAQRAAFCCIRAAGGNLFIADEPTKGLDTMLRDDVVMRLNEHVASGCLLTITHDVEVARQLGGDIIIMRNGKVVESGDSEQIINRPSSDYARTLINATYPQSIKTASLSRQASYLNKLLEVRDFTVERGGEDLFRPMDFKLAKGEIVGIFGPSGIGKTSLGDALLQLLPYRGTLTFSQPLARHKMLKLYQDPPEAFASHQTLGQLIEDVIRLHKLDNPPVDYWLEMLGLSAALLTRTAEQISGGELQRLALLRVMLIQPALLIADEPTSRLDPITARHITDLLVDSCRQSGCTLLLISHDLGQLHSTCERIITLQQP